MILEKEICPILEEGRQQMFGSPGAKGAPLCEEEGTQVNGERVLLEARVCSPVPRSGL